LNEISKVEYSSVDFEGLKVDWKKMKWSMGLSNDR
jgi:hypothetical protein